MTDRFKNIIISISFMFILLVFMISNIFLKDKDISYEERRKLNKAPSLTIENIVSGDYFEELEDYLLDQFPLRQFFREIKSFVNTKIFNQKDNNNIYIVNDDIFKMEYKLNENSVYNAAQMYNKISDKYFSNSNIYYTIVPDKNYFIDSNSGYLKLDYNKLIDIMKSNVKDMDYIDITNNLSIEDYYNTDLHWRQECLIPVAQKLLLGMDNKLSTHDYKVNQFEPFYGSYYGQAATSIKPDKLIYLTNEIIKECKVYDYEKEKYINIYDNENLNNIDAYDIYLSGAKPLLSIENPNSSSEKELYIFRDSFGSSISPLLVGEYSRIVLVDLRYINSEAFEQLIDVKENSDVLFMYNTSILNNSSVICKFFS